MTDAMDARLRAAARALSVFDPLEALQGVALRSDPPALAMRGIAMAQLGEFAVARRLLRRAATAFTSTDPVARARCMASEAEVALACRDLAAAQRGFTAAAAALEAGGDAENALFARLQLVRILVLLGKLDDASKSLASLALDGAAARTLAVAALVASDIAVRGVRPRAARRALARAEDAATLAAIPSLTEEVESARRTLEAPVARLCASGAERPVDLDDVEALFRSGDFLVDACRREVRDGVVVVSLAARPVLFALAVALGEAAPGEATRETLVRRAFFARAVSDSLRARLRVEVGRLRRLLGPLADIHATEGGFAMTARRETRILVLSPPTPGEANALVALLTGGEAWSTSALAAALGRSQRAVQRALATLEAEHRVQAVGRGRARRWIAPAPAGFATTLLLAPTRASS
jgi:hypothetical protein